MDRDLMYRRIEAIEAACTAAEKAAKDDSWWIIESAYVTIPTRRMRELLELARLGLEAGE